MKISKLASFKHSKQITFHRWMPVTFTWKVTCLECLKTLLVLTFSFVWLYPFITWLWGRFLPFKYQSAIHVRFIAVFCLNHALSKPLSERPRFCVSLHLSHLTSLTLPHKYNPVPSGSYTYNSTEYFVCFSVLVFDLFNCTRNEFRSLQK